MVRNRRGRRAKIIKGIPEQANECKFYDTINNYCDITKEGELICSYKKCSLCVPKEKGRVK
jgi:hypothetical protein